MEPSNPVKCQLTLVLVGSVKKHEHDVQIIFSVTFNQLRVDQAKMPVYPAAKDLTSHKDIRNKLISCSAFCNQMKSNVNDVTTCNSFYLDGDVCYLGYTGPLLALEAACISSSPGTFLYIDFSSLF